MEQNTQPTQQTSHPPVQIAAPAPPPKNNSGILMGIFLFVLGILVGLALDKTTILSAVRIPYLNSTSTPTSIVTPSPAPGPLANWKTYTNTKYLYTFAYPANWTIETGANQDTVIVSNDTGNLKFIVDMTNPAKITRPILSWAQKQQSILSGSGVGAFFSVITNDATLVSAEKPVIISSGNEAFETRSYLLDKDNNIYDISLVSPIDGNQILKEILSTFRFIGQSPTVSPTPEVPANWIRHVFSTYGLTMYTPDDWQSSITDYPADSNSLIKFWKKSSPTIIPIQLDIKSSWDNTGNAESQPKNFMVDGSIPAYRMDPPTKTQQTLERYQTNVYFEHGSKVYVFECVHNWTQDYLDTCNTMLSTLQFTQ